MQAYFTVCVHTVMAHAMFWGAPFSCNIGSDLGCSAKWRYVPYSNQTVKRTTHTFDSKNIKTSAGPFLVLHYNNPTTVSNHARHIISSNPAEACGGPIT